jgi:hypothetical protein
MGGGMQREWCAVAASSVIDFARASLILTEN